MARVVLENLHKSFQGPKGETVVAVRDASLVIEDREFLVLVGPSGCGKSTTLRMIAGLEEITSGTIAIDGRVVNDVPPKDRDLAMVFQNYALYPHMTVYENMAFGLKLRKFPRPEIEQRVGEAADILGLGPYLDRLPKALSGGQRQRVAVGRAIVRKPKAFLFDEPLSNLDAQMRVQMRMELAKLHRRLNATMIYVTHDQVEAMTMGDRIVVMKDGVIRQVADPLTLYRRPASRFVAGFIGSPPMNFLRGVIEVRGGALCFCEATPANSHGWRLPVGAHAATLAARAGQAVVLGIRPEDVLVPAGDPATAAEGETIATVEVVEAMGAETYLHCTTGAQSFVARVAPERRFAIGQRLRVTLPPARSHYFDPVTENALSQPAS